MAIDITNVIKGLHHVTATVDDAQADIDFYVKLLGQRLVKKTVNFDNNYVYHFYYGNRLGEPGTIMTTFPYKGEGVRVGTKGTGQVDVTQFSIPAEAVDFWKSRFNAHGVRFIEATRFGNTVLEFDDPSTLRLSLVANTHDDRDPWATDDIPADVAIRGIYAVTLSIADVPTTEAFLTDVFGLTKAATEGRLHRFVAGSEMAGNIVDVRDDNFLPMGKNGLGTVHHVAFRIESDEEQAALRAHLADTMGFQVTPFKDRKYFRSIYFRMPGGVLFEVATTGPGFAVDEDEDALGVALKLPDDAEPNRADIEKHLPKIEY